MRIVALMLMVAALAASSASAQSTDGAWAAKMFVAPKGGSTTHDFGMVPRGAQLYYRFPMMNVWQVPIEITSLRTSCGCVTASTPTTTLKPREVGYLDVTMNAHRFNGPKSVTIYVTVGPEYVSTASLQVTANSRSDIVFNPGEVNFGVVATGQKPSQVIEVEYAGSLDWRVTEIINNSTPLDATIEELYRRPGGVGYRVRIALKPEALPGSHKWELVLKTNDPQSLHVPVLVEATVQALLTVSPPNVNLRSLKVGEVTTQRITVRGTKPFRITAIEGIGDIIQADYPNVPNTIQILTIKCQPTEAGDLRRQLKIKTDLDADSSATVTVEADVSK